jgi:hypothetical protein
LGSPEGLVSEYMCPFPPSQSGSAVDRWPVTVTSCVSDAVAEVGDTAAGAEEGAADGAEEVLRGLPLNAGRGAENVTCGGATNTCGAAAVPITPSGPLPVPIDSAGVCASHMAKTAAAEKMMKPVTVLIV